jgi:hypothetical protein
MRSSRNCSLNNIGHGREKRLSVGLMKTILHRIAD